MRHETAFRRWTRAAAFLVGLAGGVGAVTGETRAEEEAPPPVSARVLEVAGGRIHEAVLPGRAVDVASYPGGGLAVLLVHESAATTEAGVKRSLYRIRGEASDTEPVAAGLPASLDAVHGRPSGLWLGSSEGELFHLPGTGRSASSLRPVATVPGLELGALVGRGLIPGDPAASIPMPEVGRLAFYREIADGLELAEEIELPVRARRLARGFELWSPALLPMHESGRPSTTAWGSRSEAFGPQRFRVLTVRADDDEPVREVWFRFPEPEEIQQHHWARIDGRDALLVTTVPGDKVGIFQKLDLWVFYVGADRTRAGRGPTMTLETVSRRWHPVDVSVHDLDGDGKDDLVLVQREGMGGDDVVVDVYPGKGNGRFDERRRRRTKLDDQGGRLHFGDDFNGDAQPDLVTVAGGRLRIYGANPSKKRRALADEPFFTLDRDARGRLRVLDTDSDPRPKIVLVHDHHGRSVVRVISVRDSE